MVGVAIDVPDKKMNPRSLKGALVVVAANMLTPGAAISGLRIADEIGLGPLDEKAATLVPTGCPMSVLEGCIFTTGDSVERM
jgi:hypothetical protein